MSFLGTFVHHPRRLWLRRALFQIHLWVGVLLSLYIVVIALTGSVLVFRQEVTRLQIPREVRAYDSDGIAPLATVLANFAKTYPGVKIEDVSMPNPALPIFVIDAAGDRKRPLSAIADPVTGTLWPRHRTWLDWVYDLHVYLLLGKAHGMQVNGVGAVCLLVLTISGIFLWWPGLKLWTRGLRVSLAHHWRRINFDAHNAIGFWTLFLVFWWAFSGVYFAWYRPVTAAINIVSPLQGMRSPVVPSHLGSGARRTSLNEILAAVHRASPEGRLFSISDPLLSGEVIYALVDLRDDGDFSHRDIVTVSTADARVLTVWHYGENKSPGDWILWAMHPLHFGTLWGPAVKILWAIFGIALAALSVTGLLMYWNRVLRHTWKRLT